MKRYRVILFLYNRLFDPVIQSNFWLYIQGLLLQEDCPYQFHLVTFEDPNYPLTDAQKSLCEAWRNQGLGWTPLSWHQGASLKSKLWDVLQGFVVACLLRLRGYRYIVSLASVAGAYAYLYSKMLGLRLYMYQYEPHSEYSLDNAIWRAESKQYRIAHFLERKSADFASVISSGTRFMQKRLEQWKVRAKFFKIPSVADHEKFIFRESDRKEVRRELGLSEERPVLLYPGKFGGLYYQEEAPRFFNWLERELPGLFFLIVTPHTDEYVYALFDSQGVSRENYRVLHSDYVDIHRYYSAADIGLISVPPGPSKCFISNIKVGEYLCSGLPFIVTRGVSEDYCYAEEFGVGVVVDDFREDEARRVAPLIRDYLIRNKHELRSHCRSVGLDYRGFAKLDPVFRKALQSLVGDEG